MRFSILSLLIASTGVAQYVTASPIRVVVTEMPNIRFGHALAGANAEGGNNHHHGNNNMIHGMLTTSSIAELGDAGRPKMHGRPCGGGMKAKALSISNAFGRMFGFRLIDVHLSFSPAPANDGGVLTILSGGHYRDLHADGNTVNHHHGSLLRRVRHALGPWESRIVAFVLGCGIGVLLRMFWVLAVVSYRLIRGQREQEEYPEVIFIEDAEEVTHPPPQYTDEKVQAADIKPADTPIAQSA